jgi:hypothetical protein
MGVAIGANPAVERSDPLLSWFDEENDEGFEVKLISEGGRFNINAIILREDKSLLRTMFIDWSSTSAPTGDSLDAIEETSCTSPPSRCSTSNWCIASCDSGPPGARSLYQRQVCGVSSSAAVGGSAARTRTEWSCRCRHGSWCW